MDDLLSFSNHALRPSSAESQFFPRKEHSSAADVCRPVSDDRTISSSSGFQSQPSSFDLCIPSEESAELEWLSKFVYESFSDVLNYHSTSFAAAIKAEPMQMQQEQPSIAAPRGARSKRFRVTDAVAAWSEALIPPPGNQSTSPSSSSSSYDFPASDPKAGHGSNAGASIGVGGRGRKGGGGGGGGGGGRVGAGIEGGVRRCTHCASERTPQWRTGPLGPKTLCNACGVRYKSGRLVPEYRPAASPSFVLAQHSNSHRKVMELRRQKELLLLNSATAATTTPASRPDRLFDGNQYGVC